MAGIRIVDVKAVGLCSKCRSSEQEAEKFRDGTIIPDAKLSCVGCNLW